MTEQKEAATFGEKLALELRRLGKTQSWLHRETGLSLSAISMMVRGKQSPSLEQGFKIAKALGVSLDYLADNGSHERKLPQGGEEGDEVILTLYRALGLTQDQALRGLALMAMPTPEEAARMRGEWNGKQSP